MRRGSPTGRRDFLKVAVSAGAAACMPRALRAAARSPRQSAEAVRAATVALDDLFAGHDLYWGDLHGHTGYSDGFGTPSAYFDYAEAGRLDFCAVSDHAEWIEYYEGRLQTQQESPIPLWANLASETEARYLPGTFVTFLGSEWTSDDYGHRTVVFGSTGSIPPLPPSTQSQPTPSDLWAALRPYTAMTIPHHVTRWGSLMDWSHHDPAMERLVEIYSKWGNGASAWTSYELPTRYRQYPRLRAVAAASGVDAMLERGYRMGIVAGSDSHQGHPGSTAVDDPLGTIMPSDELPTTAEGFFQALDDGYTVDHREPSGGGGGLAGVWATDLTREGIWDGLYARQTLGTSGIRPRVKFGVRDGAHWSSGAMMGGELNVVASPVLLASAVPESRSRVQRITLLKGNQPLLTVKNPEPGVAVSFRDDDLAVGETACYRGMIQVLQKPRGNSDGDTVPRYDRRHRRFVVRTRVGQLHEEVWTSPVWVTRASD